MTLGSGIAIYFVIWWLTLFVVLPFGVKSQVEAGEVAPGSDPGAPARFNIWRTILVNSIIAAIAFAIFYVFILPLV